MHLFLMLATCIIHIMCASELRTLSNVVKAFYDLVNGDDFEEADYIEIMEYLDQRFHRKCYSVENDYKTSINVKDVLQIVGNLEKEVKRLSEEMVEERARAQEDFIQVKRDIEINRNASITRDKEMEAGAYISSKMFCNALIYEHCLSGDCCLEPKFLNLALGKPAWQSSDYYTDYGQASAAVDGNRDTNLKAGKSCTHTKREAQPWWMVDLGFEKSVGRVIIVNRGDGSWDRLRNIVVTVTLKDDSDFEVCGTYSGPGRQGEIIEINCGQKLLGRYVKVTMNSSNYLQLCEVEVYTA